MPSNQKLLSEDSMKNHKESFSQDPNNDWDIDSEIQDNSEKRKVKKRLEDLMEKKRLRENIGMDESHNYWDEL